MTNFFRYLVNTNLNLRVKEARPNGYSRFWTSLYSQDYLPSRSSPCRRGTQDVGWADVVARDTRTVLLFQFGERTRPRRRAVRLLPLVVKRQLTRLLDQVADFLEGFAAVVGATFVTFAAIQLAIRRLART